MSDAAALDPAGLLLFSVTLDGLTLTEGLGAYGAPDDPLIPVGELARLLEADIDVLPTERRIIGRLGEARRALVIDLAAGVARAGPRDVPLTIDDSAVGATEIYLRASALRKLLPLTIEVAPDELAIRLHALEKFPVQARLQRLANRPDGSAVAGAEQAALTIAQPYAAISPPGADIVLDGGLQSGAHRRLFRYDARFGGDLLWSNFQGYLASDELGRPSSVRLLLERRSLEGGLFGPLKARQLDLGDTFTPGLALGPRSVAGRGVSLSTVPLDQTNVFNRIDLRGELPPGYDVELYVNEVLKGSTNQSANGRYEFLNVPLSPGVNVLRIVTFGPRGERNEAVQVINVGAGLLRAHEATFEFAAVDQDQPLIRLRRLDPLQVSDPGLFASGGLRVVGGVNYGLTDRLTVALGGARIPRPDARAAGVVTTGLRTSLLGLATQADAAWDDQGGSAASIGAAGQFHGLAAVLRHAEYRGGFVDENNLGADSRLALDRRTELTVDANLRLRGRILPVSLRVIRDDYAGGSSDVLAGARASTTVGPALVSAGLEYQRQAYRPGAPVETLTGYVAASSYQSFGWQIRTTFDYQLLPDVKARLLSVTVDRRLSDRWSLRVAAGQPLDRLDGWNLALSSIYATRAGDLALTGEYDNRGHDWRLLAQWSFGVGYAPGLGYRIMRSGPGSGGAAVFDAFIDANGDGVRQPDEAGAPNVAVQGGAPREALTGPDGRAYVGGLGPGPTAALDVSLQRADNTAVSTPPSRIDLRPRPGAVARIPYPMRPTGEVLVRAELLRDDGKTVGLASVRLQLVPASGQPIEAVTEFDGSAIFEAVPVAAYHLRLDPRQAEKLRMRLVESPTVAIAADGAFTPDVVVHVRFEPAGGA